MARELDFTAAAGVTYYAVVRNNAGQYWNVATALFEAFNAANWVTGKYCIALSVDAMGGTSAAYWFTFPVAITAAGKYHVDVFAQSGGAPAVTDVLNRSGDLFWDGQKESNPTAPALAAGAYVVTINVKSNGTGTPNLVGATVRLTDGAANTYSANTDVNGNVTFSVPAAAYTVSATYAGYSYAPSAQTVQAGGTWVSSGTANLNIQMTQGVFNPPTGTNTCNCVMTVFDQTGVVVGAGKLVTFTMSAGPGTAGIGFLATPATATTDGTGKIQISLVQGATYTVQGSSQPGITFTVPNTTNANLNQLLNI